MSFCMSLWIWTFHINWCSDPRYSIMFCSALVCDNFDSISFSFFLRLCVCSSDFYVDIWEVIQRCNYFTKWLPHQNLLKLLIYPRSWRTACCSVLQREPSQVRVAGSRIPGESVCSDEEFLYKVLKREMASWPLSKIITHLTCSLLLPSLLGFGLMTSPSS